MTAEKFERILASLKADAKGRSYERRGLPRVGLRMQVAFVPCGSDPDGTQHLAWLRDISVNGICIVHTEGLPVGSYFVALFPRSRDKSLGVLYQVTRSQRISNRSTIVGAKLYRILNGTLAA